MQRRLLLLVAALTAGCTTTPSGPPTDVAAELVALLDAGEIDDADELYSDVSGAEGYPERMYPVLYNEARTRYEAADGAGSARILRFMSVRYPVSPAVREALVYSLFLERASQDQAEPALLDEMDGALAELRERLDQAPAWADLVEAQVAIDRGRMPEAREAFDRFLADWSGDPPDLIVYVEDIGRYLSSH